MLELQTSEYHITIFANSDNDDYSLPPNSLFFTLPPPPLHPKIFQPGHFVAHCPLEKRCSICARPSHSDRQCPNVRTLSLSLSLSLYFASVLVDVYIPCSKNRSTSRHRILNITYMLLPNLSLSDASKSSIIFAVLFLADCNMLQVLAVWSYSTRMQVVTICMKFIALGV